MPPDILTNNQSMSSDILTIAAKYVSLVGIGACRCWLAFQGCAVVCGKLPAPNQCGAIDIWTRRPMAHERQAQFALRLQEVKALRRYLAGAGQYERAYRADLLIQRLYERWADEICSKQLARIRGVDERDSRADRG
jgi:hypothetical protein